MTGDITFLDDSTRPEAPRIAGTTAGERAYGRRLAQFHAYHLAELREVRRVLDALLAGEAEAGDLEERVSSLAMTTNLRRFGNLCGAECEMLTVHHTIEDQSLFPALRRADRALHPVLDRLAAEHEVVHALINQLEDAATTLVTAPDASVLETIKPIYEALERVVVSHFGYEERSLEEALGHYRIPL